MNDRKLFDVWHLIVDIYHIATDEELELITNINGLNIEALNNVIYVRTGYHDISQFIESEGV
jgi:hypothetical protein